MDFLDADEETWWRTSFEGLDSIKVCRGEVSPYPGEIRWASTVENSPWLKERYLYEKENYGDSYNFDGNVDEILDEYNHYLFCFHDEFIEVIAKGIWFAPAKGWSLEHIPLSDLGAGADISKREAHGIAFQIRENPAPTEQLMQDAALCSQILMQFAAELDGDASVSWTLTLRKRGDQTVSILRNFFGNPVEVFEGVAELQEVLPHVESWLAGVKNRRREMGKD